MKHGPPPWLARLLVSLWERDEHHVILEDLIEEYERFVLPDRGKLRADLWFWRQSISIVRSRPRASGSPSGRAEFLGDLGRDLRLSVRALRKSPAYTVGITVVLSLGIGANAAIYSLVEAVLFADPPYENVDRLTFIWQRTDDGGAIRMPVQAPDVASFEAGASEFESFAFVLNPTDNLMRTGDRALHVSIAAATPNLFGVLGVAPAIGSVFPVAGASGDGGPDVVLISYHLWVTHFGSDPEIVGTTVEVGGSPLEVVGVLAEDFVLRLPADVGVQRNIDLWAPLATDLADLRRDGRIRDRDSNNTGVAIGLLRVGSGLSGARAEMEQNARRLAEQSQYHREARVTFDVMPLAEDAIAQYRPFLLTMWGAVGLVLLIACTNVVGLVLARSTARAREFAVRTALGAGRGRLVRQLLAESAVLGVLGAAGGVIVGLEMMGLARRLLPDIAPLTQHATFVTVLASSLAVMLVAALGFGLVPALVAARGAATNSVSRLGAGGGRATARFGRVLVGTEIGMSLVLLVLAGLVWQTARNLGDVNYGFRPQSVVVFDATLRNRTALRGPGDRAAAVTRIEDALREASEITEVGVIGRLPLSGKAWTQPYGAPGAGLDEWSRTEANFRVMTAGYFDAIGTRLFAGRQFDGFDDRQDRRVAIVDRRLALRLDPAGEVVGRFIGIPIDGDAVTAEIVGVVENVRMESLRAESRETVYIPYRHEASRDVSFAVRYREGATPAFREISGLLDAVAPEVATFNYATMDSYVDRSIRSETVAANLIGAFALLAAFLSTYGLFGLVTYSAGQRRGETAVRIALGATRGNVVAALMRSDVSTILLGIAGGIAGAAAVTRLGESFLYGVGGLDWLTYGVAAIAIAAITLVATYIPARRASEIDPASYLREE